VSTRAYLSILIVSSKREKKWMHVLWHRWHWNRRLGTTKGLSYRKNVLCWVKKNGCCFSSCIFGHSLFHIPLCLKQWLPDCVHGRWLRADLLWHPHSDRTKAIMVIGCSTGLLLKEASLGKCQTTSKHKVSTLLHWRLILSRY
jgi:hypothetical protein